MIFVGPHGILVIAAPNVVPNNPYGVIMFGAYLPMVQAERAQLKVHNSAAAAVATAANSSQ